MALQEIPNGRFLKEYRYVGRVDEVDYCCSFPGLLVALQQNPSLADLVNLHEIVDIADRAASGSAKGKLQPVDRVYLCRSKGKCSSCAIAQTPTIG